VAAGTNIPPNLPTTALVVDGIYGRTRNPLYLGNDPHLLGLERGGGDPMGDRAGSAPINVGVIGREDTLS
jgi:hypothetical protein